MLAAIDSSPSTLLALLEQPPRWRTAAAAAFGGKADAAKCAGEVAAAYAEVLSFVARLGARVIGDAPSRVTGDGYHRTPGANASNDRRLDVSIEDGH
jgi:hypothetical protein